MQNQEMVIPLAPEAIVFQDGATKNDCEKNALKRFLANVKKDHPFLKVTFFWMDCTPMAQRFAG